MKEHEQQDRRTLLPATRELVDEVERCTGLPIAIQASERIRGHGRAVFAASDPDSSRHLILYDPKYEAFLDHHVAHECGHVVRFAAASDGDRCLPVLSKHVDAFGGLEDDLATMMDRGVPDKAIEAILPTWLGGAVAQVSNVPADIHIERWLYREFPALRSAQRRSIVDQADELHRCLGGDVRELTPESLWSASNAMNYAFLSAMSPLVERPSLLKPYRRFPDIVAQGEALIGVVDSTDDTGLAGDRWLTDTWAEHLGLGGWYEWRRLDELPARRSHAWGQP
jgi:hypothetical protein